jgi:phage tail-like protein
MPSETHLVTVHQGHPPSASARDYLRRGLPGVYRERPAGASREAFVMRFLLGLEEVLDPIVATTDLLPAHLDLDLAPPEIVALVAAWLGVTLDRGIPGADEAHRRLVRAAPKTMPSRGTRRGLEDVLRAAFDELDFEVRDGGGATFSETRGPQPAGEPTLTVVVPAGLNPVIEGAVRRLVDEVKPAHVRFELEQRERA